MTICLQKSTANLPIDCHDERSWAASIHRLRVTFKISLILPTVLHPIHYGTEPSASDVPLSCTIEYNRVRKLPKNFTDLSHEYTNKQHILNVLPNYINYLKIVIQQQNNYLIQAYNTGIDEIYFNNKIVLLALNCANHDKHKV